MVLVIVVNEIILEDDMGKKIKAKLIYTYYDSDKDKNYMVYVIDGEMYASIYNEINGKIVVDSNLTEEEYNMLDNMLEKEYGDVNE